MKNPLQTFEANTQGRDFVIGDLHGAYVVFENFLRGIDFDPAVDRIFSVGDLVDRGPSSVSCLQLLRKPWFHATLANHEQMMIEAIDGGRTGGSWYMNGGDWGYDLANRHLDLLHQANSPVRVGQEDLVPTDEDIEFAELLDLVREMPFLITVNRVDGSKIHILHAEFPPGTVGVTDSDLSSPGKVLKLATSFDGRNGDSFLWSRFLFYEFYSANLQDIEKVARTVAYKFRGGKGQFNDQLSHIISGHTILQRPLTIIGQTNIDTCAYGSIYHPIRGEPKNNWSGLTAVDINAWKFYKTTEHTFEEVEPLVVNKDDIDRINRVQP